MRHKTALCVQGREDDVKQETFCCRSNKGASKQRRDQINAEIATMRDLLPLAESARQRLSQLQIMSLSCVYIRKCNVLQKRRCTYDTMVLYIASSSKPSLYKLIIIKKTMQCCFGAKENKLQCTCTCATLYGSNLVIQDDTSQREVE